MSAVFFLSAVSSEFHHKDPERPMSFESYRDVLTRSLRRQIPGCEVIVQEELKQGYGDLLHTLDDEVRNSTVVVHLIGDVAGAEPTHEELRLLRQRHPDFLSHEPVLKASLAEADDISYTQWEAYLAFHYRRPRLVFSAEVDAPRSPRRQFSATALASQQAHFQRLQRTGEHHQPCYSQSDLAVKTVVAVERRGLNPAQPADLPPADKIAEAEHAKAEIIAAFVANLRKSVKSAVTDYDPAGIEAYLKSLDPIVVQFGLTRRFVLNLIAEERERRKQVAEDEPTPENLYDLAFGELALGHYHDAMVAVRQYIDQETRLMSADPDHHNDHRDRVLRGHLLWKDAAEYAGQRQEARRALKARSRYLDCNREPVLWADYHEEIAVHCLDQAKFDQAEELIGDIIDIREEHQPEPSIELAKSLLTWCRLLYERANYEGSLSVARRAEQIFSLQTLPDLEYIGVCCSWQGGSLKGLARFTEAEPLIRRAMAISEARHGPDNPNVAVCLHRLALLLEDTNRLAEAEQLYRRALAILARSIGGQHPSTQFVRNNLNVFLSELGRLPEELA